MNKDDVRKSVVVINPADNTNQNGLGVVSNHYILTCTHHLEPTITGPMGFAELSARKPDTDFKARMFSYMVSSWDFMVLSDQPMDCEIIDDDGGDIDEILYPEDSDESFIPLLPADIRIGEDEIRTFNGYFFDQDGITTYDVKFQVSASSLFIDMDWDERCIRGSSGSPLMTADHKLVGIMLARISALEGSSTLRAIRLDMAMPQYLRRFMEWDHI